MDFLKSIFSKTTGSAAVTAALWVAQQPNPKDPMVIAQAVAGVFAAASARHAIAKASRGEAH